MARSTQQLETETRRKTAEGVSPVAMTIFWELLRVSRGDSRRASSLLLEPGGVTVGGRSLIPVEISGLIRVSENRPTRVVDVPMVGEGLLLPQRRERVVFDDQPFDVSIPGVGRNLDKVASDLRELMKEDVTAFLPKIQPMPGRRLREYVGHAELQKTTQRVSSEAVARVLNLHPERVRIQPIIDDKAPGSLQYGRISIIPVQAVPANVAVVDIQAEPFWKQMGFQSYRDWLIRDPLLVQIEMDAFPDYPGLKPLIDNANRAMVNAVRVGVMALCDANLSRYLADLTVGKNPDLEWVWQKRISPMVAGIRLLFSSLETAAATVENLAFYEFELVRNSGGQYCAFHPQELALAHAAINEAYYLGMDVTRGQVDLAVRGGADRGSLKRRFAEDIRMLKDRSGFLRGLFD